MPPHEPDDADRSPLADVVEPGVEPHQRLRLDAPSFAYVVAAVLLFSTLAAVLGLTSTMLTRIGIGVLIALALDPLVGRLEERVGRRVVAVAIVALGVIGVGALVIALLGPRAVAQVRRFSEELPETVTDLEQLPLVGSWVREQNLAERSATWVAELPEQFTDERLGEAAGTIVSGAAGVATAVLIAIAVMIDGDNLLRRFRRLLPEPRREQADEVGRIVYRTLGRYIGGSLTVAVLNGLVILTTGLILGVPLAPVAALWVTLTNLVPQIGGFLGGSFFVLLALTDSAATAIIAGAVFVVYMNLENHVIAPAIVGKSVDLTPPTTMVAAFIGGAVAGVPGALVATPLVGATKALVLEARGRRSEVMDDTEQPPGLVERVKGLFGRGE